jgi:hypothetical protein
MSVRSIFAAVTLVSVCLCGMHSQASGEICNIKVVTGASPDYRAKFKGSFFTSELLVHDSMNVKPFDIGIALPGEKPVTAAK